ncbi:unnamed protein product [Gongylonema pulchrum]|uniref:Uncharacterized protein n=1 Tax=Gongylonema pulchrum TaxID=637853 RepID=A0A3P7PX45_9BILA|nr:unnamed protein product [Gongylonema pulchrum]
MESYSESCAYSQHVLSEKDDPWLIDVFGRTALHYAAMNNRVQILPRLFELGLKLDSQDYKGATPLYLAAREGRLDAVNLLLSLGANMNITDQVGQTPTDVAAENEHYSVVRILEKTAAIESSKRKRRDYKQLRSGSYSIVSCRSGRSFGCSQFAALAWRKYEHYGSASKDEVGGESQTLFAPSWDETSKESSSVTIQINDDLESASEVDENAAAFLQQSMNSISSFVLTPPEQILEEAEQELPLDNNTRSGTPKCTEHSSDSCPTLQFSRNTALSMEPLRV